MKAWRLLWRLIAYRPLLCLFIVGTTVLKYALELLPGLLLREIFNILTRNEPVGAGIWTLVALLVASRPVDGALYWLRYLGYLPLGNTFRALLRQNLYDQILQRPGAQALLDSSGEVISRFRDDVEHIWDFFIVLADLIGTGIVAAVALALMMRVNLLITLLVCIPFAGVTALAQSATQRVGRYRHWSNGEYPQTMSYAAG